MNEIEEERIGIIAVIYDHRYTGIMEDLKKIEHDYKDFINAVMHVHMTDEHCLEAIIVKGDIKYIRTLSEKIMRLKGVEHVRLTNPGQLGNGRSYS